MTRADKEKMAELKILLWLRSHGERKEENQNNGTKEEKE